MNRTFHKLSVTAIILMLIMSLGLISYGAQEVYEGSVELTVAETTSAGSYSPSVSLYGATEFDGCFGNQLTSISKEIYDSLVTQYVTEGKTNTYTYTFKNPLTFDAKISGSSIVLNDSLNEALCTLEYSVQTAMDAFPTDYPEVFWLETASLSCSYSAKADSKGNYTGTITSVTVTPDELYSDASSFKTEYNNNVELYADAAYDSESRYNTLKNIHDYICNDAWYNLINDSRVHTSEPFFLGDGGMVCEGYAKSFKVICDRLSIPCILVRGDAGGPHMWNYVQMEDGKWYLVDATWDDQDTDIYYTYFLATANTVGFNGKKISAERTECTDFSDTGIFNFTYPVLSTSEYVPHTHSWKSAYTVDVAPTCTTAGSKSIHCKSCTATKNSKTIPAKGHEYEEIITQATLTKNGKITYKCSCGDVDSSDSIAKVTSFTLSTTNYVYDGKNKTPKVTVKDADGNKLTKNVDYKTWIASSRSNIGKYYVKVTLMGNYSGEKKVYFYIRPGVPTKLTATQSTTWIKLTWDEAPGAYGYSVYRYDTESDSYKKLKSTTALSYTDKELNAGTKYTYKIIPYGKSRTGNIYYSKSNIIIGTATRTKTPSVTVTASGSSKVLVKWSNVSGESGYQVWYSTSEDGTYKRFGNAKANATSMTVTGLESGKTYYFKIRTYKKTDSGYIYSAYSTVKSVTLITNYYITKTGSKYHVDGCNSLSKSKIQISYKDAIAKGYTACDKCIG